MNTEPKDALGFPIVINQTYGYSMRQNGNVSIRIGTCVKINVNKNKQQTSVTLQLMYSGKGVYDYDIAPDKSLTYSGNEKRSTISVSSNTLFPLSNDVQVNWVEK